MPPRDIAGTIAGIVLAAGAGSRFGGGKLLAQLAGRPILQHVLDRLADAGIGDVTVVLGREAPAIEGAIAWRTERRVVNPDPDRGLSSSLQIGMAALPPGADAVLIALGDQPLVTVGTIRALLDARPEASRPIVVPVYADDRGRNPVLLRRPAFGLAGEAAGDRGLGPVLAAHPDAVHEVPVSGDNPDVDTQADLARAAAAAWAARVRANREQVERVREVPDGTDFYAPVRSLFRADPTRTDDPILSALLGLVRSGDRWLDVGGGAGRFALPIARALDPSGGSVVALDASPSMLEGLREIAEDYAIENIRTVEARWPAVDAGAFDADVALIAHVGYDIEAIGAFLEALEISRGTAVRGGPDAAAAGGRRRPVLAGRPRRGAIGPARIARPRRVAPGQGSRAVRRADPGGAPPVRDPRGTRRVPPAAALDRPRRWQGRPAAGRARLPGRRGRRWLDDPRTRPDRDRRGDLAAALTRHDRRPAAADAWADPTRETR